jgi:hypothetical protein
VLASQFVLLSLILPAADPPRITDNNFHGWIGYYGDHQISGKWGIHLESQFRRNNGFNRWQQNFHRTAINYDINKSLQVTGGYAWVKTYPYGEFPVRQAFDEHRIYQQVLIRQPLKRVRMQYRARFEQRWVDVQQNLAQGPLPHAYWRFQQRFRWNTRMEVPLRGKYYLAFADEILLNIPPNMPVRKLDQNRASASLGIQAAKALRVEFGYLNQYLAQRNGRILESNHTLHISIFSNLSFRRKQT